MRKLTELLDTPNPNSINAGKEACPTSYLVRKYGAPSNKLTDTCGPVTSGFWKERMVTQDVGPFRVTGYKWAVVLLQRSLQKVQERNPELYKALGSAGMLCCRSVRNHPNALSNHALGMAIDFTINKILDKQGDDKTLEGMFELYSIMKEDGWYWGAGFTTEDSMHMEVSKEVVMKWIDQGIF